MDDRRAEFFLDGEKQRLEAIIASYEADEVELTPREIAETRMWLDQVTTDLRRVQRRLYGWRFVRRTYGSTSTEDKAAILGTAARLEKEVLGLENRISQLEGVVKEYPANLKAAEKALDELRGHRQSRIGYRPTDQEMKAAVDRIAGLNRQAAEAEILLPELRRRLEEAQRELEQAQKDVERIKPKEGERAFASPGEELHARASEKAEAQKMSYADAAQQVLLEDPTLAKYYTEGGRA